MNHITFLAAVVSLAFFCTCQEPTQISSKGFTRGNPESVAAPPVSLRGTVLLEASVPTRMRRHERIFFRFSLVEPWDTQIDKESISVSLTHTPNIIMQKKHFSGKDANTIGTNRTFAFSSLLVTRKKGEAKITITASCRVCNNKGKCRTERVIRVVSFSVI